MAEALTTGGRSVAPAVTLAEKAAVTSAAVAGRPPPRPTRNMLVVPHTGRMVEDFNDPRTMIAAYFHLFSRDVGGHLDECRRKLTFSGWAVNLLRRRYTRFRESRTFVLRLAAITLRRKSISNLYCKLAERLSRRIANTLAGITPDDLFGVASEIEGGSKAVKVLADRLAAE